SPAPGPPFSKHPSGRKCSPSPLPAPFQGNPKAPPIPDAEGPVVQPVTGPAPLPPNLPPVVRPNITLIAAIVISLDDLIKIEGAVPVGSFNKIAVPADLHIPDVGKGNAVGKFPHHPGHVVGGIGAQGPAAKGDAVTGAVHQSGQPAEILPVFHDAGHPEHAPGRIVGMDGHPDSEIL